MSYSQERQDNLVNDNLKSVNKTISICRKVKETLETSGWKDVIAPIIDREIIDVVGGKIGDTWVGGKISRARLDERREYWVGYKQALMNLSNRIMFHLDELKRSEESLKVLEGDKARGPRIPMLEDSRYAP